MYKKVGVFLISGWARGSLYVSVHTHDVFDVSPPRRTVSASNSKQRLIILGITKRKAHIGCSAFLAKIGDGAGADVHRRRDGQGFLSSS